MSIISFDEEPASKLSLYVLGSVMALLVFGSLLLAVIFIPQLSRIDLAISSAIQSLRTPALDRIMLGITLLADTRLGTIIVTSVVLGLWFLRRFWLGIHLASVALCASMAVSLCKSLMARARPELVDSMLVSFSFPSGHSCTAALVSGLLALLLAHGCSRAAARYVIYAVAVLLALAIAFSRVYLLAHWPTDVVAGLALGYALIIAFAWQLRSASSLNVTYLTPALLTGVLLIYTAYLVLQFSDQAIRYGLEFESLF